MLRSDADDSHPHPAAQVEVPDELSGTSLRRARPGTFANVRLTPSAGAHLHGGTRRQRRGLARHVSLLSAEATTGTGRKPIGDLAASWAELVKVMALGPEPKLRECPVCHKTGMRAATLCGYCWTKLLPL